MSPLPQRDSIYETMVALRSAGLPFVFVLLADALGSTPQDAGAKMLVTPSGLHTGTVGGGRVEAKAIAFAQELLRRTGPELAHPQFVNWTLKGDVGMTCGGSVKLYFEPHPGVDRVWPIAIFGAGHIVQALVPVLQPLNCHVTVYDNRPEWVGRLPNAWNVRSHVIEDFAAAVAALPPSAFVLCMTQGHKTDRPILLRALRDHTFPYVACIGSAAKAAVLRQELLTDGLTSQQVARIHCPIGLDFGTNHPHEIALSIAAQLVTERDRLTPTRRSRDAAN